MKPRAVSSLAVVLLFVACVCHCGSGAIDNSGGGDAQKGEDARGLGESDGGGRHDTGTTDSGSGGGEDTVGDDGPDGDGASTDDGSVADASSTDGGDPDGGCTGTLVCLKDLGGGCCGDVAIDPLCINGQLDCPDKTLPTGVCQGIGPGCLAQDGGVFDGGVTDGGILDSGPTDGGVTDGGILDSGPTDGGVTDGGTLDSGPIDGGTLDSGPIDGGVNDGGSGDTGAADGGDGGTADAGPGMTPSVFGVHLGNWTYQSAESHIRELGEKIFVRNEFYRDAFGWRMVKGSDGLSMCQSCCDKARTSCTCKPNELFYWHCAGSDLRDSLLTAPIVVDFYNNNFNQFISFMADHYDDSPPKSLVPAYPTGHEDIYRGYVSYIVGHFSDKAKYWQVGNENDLTQFWLGTPQEYAAMVVIASEEVRRNCPDCKVAISFSSPGVPSQWSAGIGGICSSIDVIDLHYINGFHTSPFILPGELDTWKQACPGKEIVSTETGIPDIDIGTEPQAGGSPELQAQDLIKYNTLMFAEGYTRIFWYLVDTDYGSYPEIFLHDALIDETGSRKPAFTSYKTMIRKVDYFTSLTRLADGQYKYQFAGKGPVYVLWCASGPCNLPSEIAGMGTVKVTDYLGIEQTRSPIGLALTQSPIYVEAP